MSQQQKEIKIWYPYEVFYIESMLTIARSAMESQTQLQIIIKELENGRPNTKDATDTVIDLVQNLLINAASISRYFWPASSDRLHKKRGQRLREVFSISESNPLKDRNVRNFMEHFDEKLDIWLSVPVAGTIIPSSVGRRITDDRGVQHFFRAFHTDDWTFEILRNEVKVIPIIGEIIRIYLLLEEFRKEGRFPKSSKE